MNVLAAPLTAVLVGLFVRSRMQAVILYLVIEALLFTFQTLAVQLAWMAGEGGFGGAADQGAFGPPPTAFPVVYSEGDFWGYGLVNAGIILAGMGLLLGVMAVRKRARARKHQVPVT